MPDHRTIFFCDERHGELAILAQSANDELLSVACVSSSMESSDSHCVNRCCIRCNFLPNKRHVAAA